MRRQLQNLLHALYTLSAIAIFSIQATAGIQGSDHDLVGGGEELCLVCHIPRNILEPAVWHSSTRRTFIKKDNLCYTCHDGGVTNIGATTAFNLMTEQHTMVGTGCSSSSGCHDIHDQNPNMSGRFLVASVVSINNSYCEDCHDATPFLGAEGLGDHSSLNSHFMNGTSFVCEQCHSAHGATFQTTNPPGLTNPILLYDNQSMSFYGEFCISCHKGNAPEPALPGTGGVAASDVFDYSEMVNDGAQTKHPTTSVTGLTPVGGCNLCHDIHTGGRDPINPFCLIDENSNSIGCLKCHTSGGAPHIGGSYHPCQVVVQDNSMNAGLSPALPWGHEIDEDGKAGPDYPRATANTIVCESCHSVHRKGYEGGDSGHLLRYPSGSGNQLCKACHSDN